jgi:hypothetical protein
MRHLNGIPSRCTVERIRRLGSGLRIKPESPPVTKKTAARVTWIRELLESISGPRLFLGEKGNAAGGEDLEEPTPGMHTHLSQHSTSGTPCFHASASYYWFAVMGTFFMPRRGL